MSRHDSDDAGATRPFRFVELTGRGAAYACNLPGPSADSPTVVLLHGLFATGSLNWSPFLEDLTAHYRVIAVDHRGHGRGIVGDDEFSLEACADDVAALLGALGTGPAILVGYSMGGPIAQLVWRRHPDVVRGLVLCATAGRFGLTSVDDLLLPVVDGAGRALSMLPGPLRSLIAAPALALLVPDPALRADTAAAVALHHLPSIRAAVRSTARYNALDWLDEVSVPTTVVITERDRVVPPGRQQELADLIPDAEAIRIDADHLACFDDVDTFGTALLAACRSVATRTEVRATTGPVARIRARWRAWWARRRATRGTS
jgi:pimeloyl-ACP methyl ester carboxylesterase